MERQSGLSELSVISWVSAIEGCPGKRSSTVLYRCKSNFATVAAWYGSYAIPSYGQELLSFLFGEELCQALFYMHFRT